MKGTELLEVEVWRLSWLGLEHPFFTLNKNTLINTWIIVLLIALFAITCRYFMRRSATFRYLVVQYVQTFMDLIEQTMGKFSYTHFCFITALFTFIVVCNTILILPYLEEPTKDLNTTLALGIIAFFYTQYWAIKGHGLWAYIKEYFAPIFVMFPLHVIGKFASVVSISFRLFGNIFGGSIIGHIFTNAIAGSIVAEILGIIPNLIILCFFGLFEGFLQAFIFTILTLTYLTIAIQGDDQDNL